MASSLTQDPKPAATQEFDPVLSSVLVSMAQSSGVQADELLVRQWIREARASTPGDVEEHWWQWLRVAASSLGMNTRIVEISLPQAIQLARDGMSLMTVVDHQGKPTVLQLSLKSKRVSPKCVTLKGTTLLDEETLIASLMDGAIPGNVRWLASDTVAFQTNLLPEGKPWKRLFSVIQAEASDIWIVIVFAFVVGLLTLATPIAVKSLVDTVAFGRYLQPVVVISLLLLGFLSFQAAMRGLQTYVVEIIQRRMFARVTAALSYRLPRVDHEALDATDGPELVNRFLDIVTVQKVTANLLLDGISIVLATAIGMVVLAFYHPWLLGFDVMLLGSIVAGIWLLGRGAVRTALEESKYKYKVMAWFEDLIHSHLALKLGGGADFASERANYLTSSYLRARQSHFRILLRQILFVFFLQAIAATVLLGFGGWLVIQGQLSLGQLVAAELILSTILASLTKLGKHLEGLYDAQAAVDKLGYLFDLPLESRTGLIQIWPAGPVAIELTDLNYSLGGHQVFSPAVNGSIAAGALVAVTGPAGSGKSVLLDLLYGLRNPAGGHIAVGGYDPKEIRPETLRERVALVRPDLFLSGPLVENIHLHRAEVGAAQVRDALIDVGLIDDMRLFPEGINTPLTQQGIPLTTSQQQQVLLARALSGSPNLLLIDTSLDFLPQETIAELIPMLRAKEMTVLVATNRPDVIQLCDESLELGSPLP